jgi:hypothetical protein
MASSESEDSREKKKSKKHFKKARRRRRHDDSSESSKVKRKHRKKKHKKKSRDYHSSDETSSSSSDYYHHKKRGRKHKSRDYSSDSDGDDSRRHDKKKKRKKRTSSPPAQPTFGQYGIIKASDMHKKQRSFEVWLAEVKGIRDFNGPRWELQNYFADYMEDYNTATLPHIKYYDYDDWEMKEYKRKQQEGESAAAGKSSIREDEARHLQEMKRRAEEKQREELQLVRQMMNPDKVADMKHKAQLQAELAHAFKTGDVEKQRRIQKKLEPEK